MVIGFTMRLQTDGRNKRFVVSEIKFSLIDHGRTTNMCVCWSTPTNKLSRNCVHAFVFVEVYFYCCPQQSNILVILLILSDNSLAFVVTLAFVVMVMHAMLVMSLILSTVTDLEGELRLCLLFVFFVQF